MNASTLAIPAKADPERDQVADAWAQTMGTVLRVDRFWEPPAVDPSTVRLYGNDTFCLVLAQILELELVSPPDDLLVTLGVEWLGREVGSVPLHDAASVAFPRFVKPMVPKQFRAAVYADVVALLAETTGLEPETTLIVSEVVEFHAETRIFVLDGEVRTAACYEGSADLAAAVNFAGALVESVKLPRTVVLDVGSTARGFELVEANATWGAGLNGCDPAAVVACIEAATTFRNDPRT